jgi:NAD(P)H-flavin reductase
LSLNVGGEFRPYSISSVETSQDTFEVCIDTKPGGLGSAFATKAELGTVVMMLIPLGKFTLSSEDKPTIFLATGSGIAPFRSMLMRTLRNLIDTKVELIWGMKHDQNLFWLDFWQELQNNYPNFTFSPCISRQVDSKYFKGRVTDFLEQKPSLDQHQAYLCGGGEMIKATKEILITKNIQEENIYYEKYY